MTLDATVIAFGGTGVIGHALAEAASRRGLSVLALSLDPDIARPGFRNRQIDFATAAPGALAGLLEREVPTGAPLRALVAIAGLAPVQLSEAARFARDRSVPFGLISSCLLYDSAGRTRVDETAPMLSASQAHFPYQRRKLAEEAALEAIDGLDRRIFRTNHVIGPGGLLGCVPDHNRDPQLLQRLRRGDPLALARCGRIRLAFVHALDLAEGVLDLCGRAELHGTPVNLVHPELVWARDYFDILAEEIGAPQPSYEDFVPDPEDFWSLTAQDAPFVTAVPEARNRAFRFDLRAALADALRVGDDAYASQGALLRQRIGAD